MTDAAITSTLKKTLPSIDIVGASAGTGKTTRLVNEFLQAVEGVNGHDGVNGAQGAQGEDGSKVESGAGMANRRAPIDPTRIIVCTFTNKAAEELSVRIRQKLLERKSVDAAHLVITSYVGTVNSICGRLLKDFAFECGLSPHQDVIPEHMQNKLFAIASSSVLDAYAQRIEHIARRLSFNEHSPQSKFRKRPYWMDHVRTICVLARANGMTSDVLRQSAIRSWEGMQKHLGTINEQYAPEQLDDLLRIELELVINKIDLSADSTGKTAKELQNLRECFSHARNSELTWRDWASISKLDVGKESIDQVKDLINVCRFLPHHSRLHSDLSTYLTEIFECAVECIDAYQDYKKANGLVDFVDQEHLTLELLDNPRVRESLKSRFDLVLIDEFQDTSPIQLALFLKLAQLVKHSIWVGDVKQSIYGFRGTDPQLMQECAQQFNRLALLKESHRSRPELVRFANETFRRVFPAYGIGADEVTTVPSGKRTASDQSTIELWRCQGNVLEQCFSALASAIREAIHGENVRRVEDPESGILRPLRGSDIAILSRKNDHCSQIANELAERGLKVAMNRDGLLHTPETLLTIGALRYLVDPSDKIALGYLVHLGQNYQSSDQASWLERWLNSSGKAEKLLPNYSKFEEVRKLLPRCTIGDALNLAIDAGCVFEMISGWGNVSYRLSNIDALRGLVADYEDTCAVARTAATINGFLVYLDQLDECEQPASIDFDAVQVLTYHGAKGLEWPVVILTDLDAEAAPKVHKDLCKIHVEGADSAFDITDPLRDRWIRFWPWPFGAIEKDQTLEPSAAASLEFQKTAIRARAENTRLVYVGVTRARDFLIFAPYTGRTLNKTGTQWLEELLYDGAPVLRLPESPEENQILVGDTEHMTTVYSFDGSSGPAPSRVNGECADRYWPRVAFAGTGQADDAQGKTVSDEAVQDATWDGGTRDSVSKHEVVPDALQNLIAPPGARLPYILRPSNVAAGTAVIINEPDVLDIGSRLAITGAVDMALLGDCVHDFLAIDDPKSDLAARTQLADRIRKQWLIDQIAIESLLLMSDRLAKFLEHRFGKSGQSGESGQYTCYRECPVNARIGGQRLRGTIDLLVETADAFHIIDHKTFPGPMDQLTAKAVGFAPQLDAYRKGMQQASQKPVVSLLIHLPILGKVIDISGC